MAVCLQQPVGAVFGGRVVEPVGDRLWVLRPSQSNLTGVGRIADRYRRLRQITGTIDHIAGCRDPSVGRHRNHIVVKSIAGMDAAVAIADRKSVV